MNLFDTSKKIHFIGIGGIGMSGMAEFLFNHGFDISGSDISSSERTKHLSSVGIKISSSHQKSNIKNHDLVVYSSAVNHKNIEIIRSKELNIPIMKRSQMLGELIKIKDTSVGVAGTHGKTTTSSMLGSILYESKLDPTLIIGGIVNKFNSNNISGNGDFIVVEADEFDKSFLSLKPTYAILNNLDKEHLDTYKNIKNLKDTFCKYANSVPFYGKVAINNDSRYLVDIKKRINKPSITFGIENNSDIMAKDIKFDKNKSSFKVISKIYGDFKIQIQCPGTHNVYNALAATALSLDMKISKNNIINSLKKYSGVKRRFEIKYENKNNNIMVIDDYAHHPVEIKYTIDAIKSGWNSRLISIYEPHLFSRTKEFKKEIAEALLLSDKIIITDIYGSREKQLDNIKSDLIINELNSYNHGDYLLIGNKNNICNYLKNKIKQNDTILVMGAGQINSVTKDIVKIIKENYEKN
tara:strand:+ start:19708 stop:21108 length:1401 start_codon:yes stop_codon:yes gene_type:complete